MEFVRGYREITQNNLNQLYGAGKDIPKEEIDSYDKAVLNSTLGIIALRLADLCDELAYIGRGKVDIDEGAMDETEKPLEGCDREEDS